MAPVSTVERCKWVADRLKTARADGDLTIEFALQIRLDRLLDKLYVETRSPAGPDSRPRRALTS